MFIKKTIFKFVTLTALPCMIFFVSCRQVEKIADPAVDLLKRGSCVSVDIPPITLTPSRTAAERQLIGEDRELEKDGWMLASAQSARLESESILDPVDWSRRYYREKSILDYYEPMLKRYKSLGILGEGRDGYLSILPAQMLGNGKAVTPDAIDLAGKVSNEVNVSRRWIYHYMEKTQKDSPPSKPAGIAERDAFMKSFRKQAESGWWIQDESKAWVRVR